MTRIQRAPHPIWLPRLFAILALAGTAFSGPSAPAANGGAIIHVDSGLDNATGGNGLCTLREAINNANSDAVDTTGGDCETGVGDDAIVFDGNNNITLNSQLPDITSDVTITGNGVSNTQIQANAASGAAVYRVFLVGGAGHLTLTGLVVRNGRCVVGCATSISNGGGIFVATGGALDVLDSKISNNEARGSDSAYGGGIFAGPGTAVNIVNTTLEENYATNGGGMYSSGVVVIDGSIFQYNSATGYTGGTADFGGAIMSVGTLTITNSSFDNNTAVHTSEITGYGGAIWTQDGAFNVTDSTFRQNGADLGGAVFLYDGTGDILGTTFDGNYATNGVAGGIYAQQPTHTNVTNSTFTGNTALSGSAVLTSGSSNTVTIVNSTFSGNGTGPAIYNNALSLNLKNNILADGTGATDCETAPGTVGLDVNNLIENNAAPPGDCGTPVSSSDPMLGVLANNGGPTDTMALLGGSPAIDAGDDTTCGNGSGAPDLGAGAVDQRGLARPRGPHCDMGAYERIPPLSDFDYDDKSDPAKFVPGTGYAWWLKSSTGLWDSAAMGSDVDSYVSRSDFNGDAQADPGKYVAAGQALYYLLSPSYAAWDGDYMGTGTYTLIPGSDFDGDQVTDPAKYQSDGSVWWLPSSTAVWEGTFIGTDAAPTLPGSDYDGDGMTDVAKYVAAGAIWYLGSSDSTWHGQYIGADGTPVPASDFDGDGITDTAKYLTGSNVLWWLGSNSGAWTGVYLGPGASIPVPAADFDGDGKTDPARFDTGGKALWWIRSSDGGLDGAYMGPETYDIVN